MALDIGAGLSSMGDAVGKLSSLAALEQQKSGLETEKLKLANDLAMQRESAGRQEAATLQSQENQRHEGFLSTQTDKELQSRKEIAQIGAGASLAAAGMHLQAVREQISAAEKHGDFKINEDGTASIVNTRDGTSKPVLGDDGSPVKFSNPDKARAQAELITTTRDQLTSTVRLYEADLKQAQAEYTAALKSPSAMVDPMKDPGVIAAKKAIDDVRLRYEPRIQTMSNRMDALYGQLGVKAGVPTPGGPGIIKYDAQGNRVGAPAAPGTPQAPSDNTGLINGNGLP